MDPPSDPPDHSLFGQSEMLDRFAETLAFDSIESEQEVPLPQKIGRFDVIQLLGTGAFGAVLLARDDTLSRNVAIKIPRGKRTDEEIEKFLFEARQMGQLQHPGIVSVYDVGREGPLCFIVTEYLEGETLKERIVRQPLSLAESIQITIRLADAVGHAHSRGIVHRDIKPGNVMLTRDGRCVLLDFGLATNDLDSVHGEVAGTPSYMAPEQVRGESQRIDGRTDVYSLGVMLYEMLTGRVPFRANDIKELFRRIREESFQPVRQLNPALPRELDEICEKALHKKMTNRFMTAGDFSEALQGITESLSGETAVVTTYQSDVPAPVVESWAGQSETRSIGAPDAESSQTRKLREAELRNVSLIHIGFDITDSSVDPEEQHLLAESFSIEAGKIAAEFGGHPSSVSGNEIGFCFGFPVSYEDATARAIRCGMRLLNSLGGLPVDLEKDQVFVAVHCGQAVAEETHGGIKTTGEVNQTLTRLMAVVEPGEVVITEAAHKSTSIFFDSESLGPARVRGMKDPLTLYRISGEKRGTLNRVELVDPGNLTPLIGRDTELHILKDRWEETIEELGQIVILIGEAGLGKSRLIREIREHVRDSNPEADIVELRCSPYHQSAGLYPVIEHFTHLFDFDTIEEPESRFQVMETYLEKLGIRNDTNSFLLASLMGVVTDRPDPIDVSPQRKREMTGEFLLNLLRRRAELDPVLFIVEDLHWVDPSLLDLLTEFVETFDQYRVLSLFTFRPEFETPWHSKPHQTQLALNRLPNRQVKKMLETRLDRKDLPEVLVEQFIERTAGVPLFVEEFSNLLAENGELDDADLAVENLNRVIPSSLQDLLMARLDRMESNPEVIQLAAAIGREFTFDLIDSATDLPSDELEKELDKLCEAEVLFRKGKIPHADFMFKHALIQDSAYDSMLKKKRQQIHSRIAQAIEQGLPDVVSQQPELLAHHFTEAGVTDRALEYWLNAGKRSQELSANVESIDHFESGLKLLEELPASPQKSGTELAFQLGLSLSLMAVRGYANPVVDAKLERAREICEEIGEQAPWFPVFWANWANCLVAEKMIGARKFSNELLGIAEKTGLAGDKAEAYLSSACVGSWTGEWKAALQDSIDSLSHFDLETSLGYMAFTGQNVGLMASQYKVLNSWYLGNVPQAYEERRRGCELAEQINHPFSTSCYRWHTGLFGILAKDTATARQDMEIGLSKAEEHSFTYWIGMNTMLKGAVLQQEGKLSEAIDSLKSGIDIVLATGAKNTVTIFMAFLAEALRETGKTDEANRVLADAVEHMESLGGRFSEIEILLAQSALQDDPNAAIGFVRRALEESEKRGSTVYALKSAIRLHQLGESSLEDAQRNLSQIEGPQLSPALREAEEYLRSKL